MVEETLDELSIAGLRLYQSVRGYRYSLDPVLLANFVRVKPGGDEAILDLGTGSGIIPLLLAGLYDAGNIVAIEVQQAMAARAERNVRLNGYSEKIRVVHGDLRDIDKYIEPECFQLVVSNPPFRPAGGGRVAPDNERGMARHELAGGLDDFIAAAKFSLRHGGRFVVIYLVERMAELLTRLSVQGLEPKRLRMVHSTRGSDARLVMVEARKGGRTGLEVAPPLYVYDEPSAQRNYTAEVRAMYGGWG